MSGGDLATAEAHARRGIEVAEATANRAVLSWMQVQVARLAVRRGDLPFARGALARGLSLASALGLPSVKSAAAVCFAELLHAASEAYGARLLLTLAAVHPATTAPDRDEMLDLLARWGGPVEGKPGIGFDELLQRIVAEKDVAHAPLVALLNDAR